MEGKPGEGPEAMDVTLSCPAIWPMLLVAMLEASDALLRFMPLPLYMLLLFCWLNCGDACCCENILLTPILPCGHPFMSGEPWKAALCWPCCIIGDCAWAMRGESRGLCGVPGPPNVPSACWLIPVDQKRSARLSPRRLVNKPMQ